MKHAYIVEDTRNVIFEDFRLEYRLLRRMDESAGPMYGLFCKATRWGLAISEYRNPTMTSCEAAARRLFELAVENAVFPDHIDDVAQDLQGILYLPNAAGL